MTIRRLADTFEGWQQEHDVLVLATVCSTAGSTYSKAGAQMLIAPSGDYQGLLSGGCLEGDLAQRAQRVAESGDAELISYDLADGDDALWGLGVGCDGMLRILLQRITRDESFEPLASILQVYMSDGDGELIVALDGDDVTVGASLVRADSGIFYSSVPAAVAEEWQKLPITSTTETRSWDGGRALFARLRPLPRILVLGAGLDAEPLISMMIELGWRVAVADHRPSYVERGNFSRAEAVDCIAANELASTLDLDSYDAAIVMSHHLETDKVYLRQLAAATVPYVGLLGPPHRKARILDEIADAAPMLDGRLRGPAGLPLPARGPAEIALAITAELQQILSKPRQDPG